MTISFVQGAANNVSLGGSVSAAFPSAVATGNLMIIALGMNSNSQLSASISDTLTSTWQTAITLTTAAAIPYQIQVWYVTVVAGGAETVTVGPGSGSADCRVWIHEYAGVDTLDQVSTATGTAATLDSGSQATTHANELIWGLGVSNNGVTSAGTGFTLRETAASESSEDKIVTSSGSYNTTFPDSGGGSAWLAAMATFYSSSGSGPTSTTVAGTATFTGTQHKKINKLLIA